MTSAVMIFAALPACAVEIDGSIDPQEWEGAQHFADFRKVQPLNGEPATLQTQARQLMAKKEKPSGGGGGH